MSVNVNGSVRTWSTRRTLDSQILMLCLVLFITRNFFPTNWLNLHTLFKASRVNGSVHPRRSSNRGWTRWIIESVEIEGHCGLPFWKDRWSYFCGRDTYLQSTQAKRHRCTSGVVRFWVFEATDSNVLWNLGSEKDKKRTRGRITEKLGMFSSF